MLYETKRNSPQLFHQQAHKQQTVNRLHHFIVIGGFNDDTMFHVGDRLLQEYPAIINIWKHRHHEDINENGLCMGKYLIECFYNVRDKLGNELKEQLLPFYQDLKLDPHLSTLIHPAVLSKINDDDSETGGSLTTRSLATAYTGAGSYASIKRQPSVEQWTYSDVEIDLSAFESGELELPSVRHEQKHPSYYTRGPSPSYAADYNTPQQSSTTPAPCHSLKLAAGRPSLGKNRSICSA